MTNKSKNTTVKFFNPEKVNIDIKTNIEGFIAAGFPSPANDYVERDLDLKELIVHNESATYYLEVVGNSMINAGIFNGDILVVDRSYEPLDNSILVCFIDGEFTVKKVKKISGDLYLMPENPDYKPIKINEFSDLKIFGVVSWAFHNFRKNVRTGRRK